MKKRVLIASIFSGETLNSMIVKLSPTDVILVVEENLENMKGDDVEKKKKAIKSLQENFGAILKIDFIRVKSIYDVYEVSKEMILKIDQIKDANIVLNISEGRKPISFGMSFAAYLRKDRVEAIYYLVKETDTLLKMPFLNFSVNRTQKEILGKLAKKDWQITLLKEEIKKSKSVFYKYIKELKTNGFIIADEELIKITDLGRMMIL